MTRVVNIFSNERYDIYCGRPGKNQNGYFGNPHTIGNCKLCGKLHDRDAAIEAYGGYFKERIAFDREFRRRILNLRGKILGCFCKPKRCHCDIIVEYVDNMKYYTGIGSRKTPSDILRLMEKIAEAMAKKNFILRSGGADGADSAFETGCDINPKEIYLPWKNFNKNDSHLYKVSNDALNLASTIHQAWGACSVGAKKLHGRNCYQVLGLNLDTPSEVLICWTLDGQEKGGTRTAIVLAKEHGIPVYNLAIEEDKEKIIKKLKIT